MTDDPCTSDRDRRQKLLERGWSDDVEIRRSRRPKQEIDPSDRVDRGGGLVLTPSWIYACTECGEERRIATEDVSTWTDCDTCGENRLFEPLGELIYPSDGGNSRNSDTGTDC